MRESSVVFEKMRSVFTSSIVEQVSSAVIHDVRVACSELKAAIELALIEFDRGDLAGTRKRIEAAIEKIERTAELADVIRLYEKSRKSETVELQVNDVISSACRLCKASAELRSVKIAISLDPSMPKARFSENQLLSIVLNLVMNAIYFSHERQTVFVRSAYRKRCNEITIEVEDHGLGMDDETKRRLFEPFFSTKQDGVGLGLYAVMNFVNLLGGSIQFDTKKFRGTVFTITLKKEV
jgi:signal transduction histidine kinase